jgi:hypothetical protein
MRHSSTPAPPASANVSRPPLAAMAATAPVDNPESPTTTTDTRRDGEPLGVWEAEPVNVFVVVDTAVVVGTAVEVALAVSVALPVLLPVRDTEADRLAVEVDVALGLALCDAVVVADGARELVVVPVAEIDPVCVGELV